MKFDFTPDPKVLLALTHTPMQPFDALCELIDNAIDSVYSAKIQGILIENPMVLITLPSRKQLMNNGIIPTLFINCFIEGQVISNIGFRINIHLISDS